MPSLVRGLLSSTRHVTSCLAPPTLITVFGWSLLCAAISSMLGTCQASSITGDCPPPWPASPSWVQGFSCSVIFHWETTYLELICLTFALLSCLETEPVLCPLAGLALPLSLSLSLNIKQSVSPKYNFAGWILKTKLLEVSKLQHQPFVLQRRVLSVCKIVRWVIIVFTSAETWESEHLSPDRPRVVTEPSKHSVWCKQICKLFFKAYFGRKWKFPANL